MTGVSSSNYIYIYIPTYMQSYHIISFWVKLHYVARWMKLPKKIDEEKETSLNLIFTNNTYAFPYFSIPWNYLCFYYVQFLLCKTDFCSFNFSSLFSLWSHLFEPVITTHSSTSSWPSYSSITLIFQFNPHSFSTGEHIHLIINFFIQFIFIHH